MCFASYWEEIKNTTDTIGKVNSGGNGLNNSYLTLNNRLHLQSTIFICDM